MCKMVYKQLQRWAWNYSCIS